MFVAGCVSLLFLHVDLLVCPISLSFLAPCPSLCSFAQSHQCGNVLWCAGFVHSVDSGGGLASALALSPPRAPTAGSRPSTRCTERGKRKRRGAEDKESRRRVIASPVSLHPVPLSLFLSRSLFLLSLFFLPCLRSRRPLLHLRLLLSLLLNLLLLLPLLLLLLPCCSSTGNATWRCCSPTLHRTTGQPSSSSETRSMDTIRWSD